MSKFRRLIALVVLLMTTLSLAGCDGNVGVGVSVGVPVGSHGHMRVGGTRWY
jgi:predicted small secreted protein